MSALKKIGITVAVVAGVVAAIPLMMPLEHWRPDLESALAQRLQSPVKVAKIDFSYAPKPRVLLHGIHLGQGDAEIAEVAIPLTMGNLLHFRSTLNDVTVSGGKFNQAYLVSIPDRLRKSASTSGVAFGKVAFEKTTVKLAQGEVGPFGGSLHLNADGSFKDIAIVDASERATLMIRPSGEQFALTVEAKNWEVPGRYPIRLDQLIMRGMAGGNGVDFDDIQVMVYNGVVVGTAQLRWGDNWQLSGTLSTKSIQAEPFIAEFSTITRSTGRLSGVANFLFEGTGYASLMDTPKIDMKLSIADGMLHNFDLVSPLKSQSPTTQARGGQTRFDTLTTDVLLTADTVKLSNVNLNGGKFTAQGAIAINRENGKLNGNVNARLQSGPMSVASTMSVSGEVDAPVLRTGGVSKGGGMSAQQVY